MWHKYSGLAQYREEGLCGEKIKKYFLNLQLQILIITDSSRFNNWNLEMFGGHTFLFAPPSGNWNDARNTVPKVIKISEIKHEM